MPIVRSEHPKSFAYRDSASAMTLGEAFTKSLSHSSAEKSSAAFAVSAGTPGRSANRRWHSATSASDSSAIDASTSPVEEDPPGAVVEPPSA